MTLFFGGVPTKPDVDRLLQKIDASPGNSVSCEDVARVIGVAVADSRFISVTTSWRKRLFREHLTWTVRRGGKFVFLTADEAQDEARSDLAKVGRSAGRLRARTATVNPADLSSDERRQAHFLLVRETEAIHEAVAKSAKAIAAPGATKPSNLRLASVKK